VRTGSLQPESCPWHGFYYQEFILNQDRTPRDSLVTSSTAMAPVYLASMREMLSEKTTSYLNSINYVRPIRVHCPHLARDFCVAPVPLD
jgi:hypothetical protein